MIIGLPGKNYKALKVIDTYVYTSYLANEVTFNQQLRSIDFYDISNAFRTLYNARRDPFTSPAHRRRSPNIGSLLAHRMRRWSSIHTTLCERLVLEWSFLDVSNKNRP